MNLASIPLIMTLLSADPGGSLSDAAPGDTVVGQIPEALTLPQAPRRMVRIKTNALPWAATVMNVAGEIELTGRISVSVPVWWCPWFISEREALRILAVQPEGRWWFASAGYGHFIGPHISLAWYNLRHGDYRYQDSGRPLLGAGVTYGYVLRIGREWHLEFSIGAGYASMRYDRFYNTVNGARADVRQTSYWGIDHVGVSVAYTFRL